MAYEIEQRKVAGVVIETNNALKDKNFNHGELVLGLSEMLGRIIVDAAQSTIQVDELVKVVQTHMSNTIKIGLQVREKSHLIQGV